MSTLSDAKCTEDISSKEIPLLARPSRSETDSKADSEANPEVDFDQRIIEKLELKSKYIRGICLRRTFLINQNNENDPYSNVHHLIWWKKSASNLKDERSTVELQLNFNWELCSKTRKKNTQARLKPEFFLNEWNLNKSVLNKWNSGH